VQPDIQNVEVPDWIAGGSALVLFIALCVPWWVRISFMGQSGTGGASFGWLSVLSVLAALAGVGLTLFDVELPFPTGLLYLGAGAFAVLMVLLVMLVRPIGAGGFTITGISKLPWISSWFGLLASIGIVVGGFMKFQSER
jgi:hypothetical protein